jgi:hypothetical protein
LHAAILPVLPNPPKRAKTEEVEFVGEVKTRLTVGVVAAKFGGLLDRDEAKEKLFKGLEYLASKRGREGLDKKEVPVLGLSATSEAGKTEFLRWIFNNCCTFVPGGTQTARTLLQRINEASPEKWRSLDKLLVVFASFSQQSTYMVDEGPIISTTVERLLRSFHGNISMDGANSWKNRRYTGFSNLQDVMAYFSKQGNTGFIFCIDELSKLRSKADRDYRELMDNLLMVSQIALEKGEFCAIVGSALSVYDYGEVVLQASGRPLWPIEFPLKQPEMECKAESIIRSETDIGAGAKSFQKAENFWLRVTMQMLQSSPSVFKWSHLILGMSPTQSRVRLPSIFYGMHGIEPDEIFLLAARSALERQKSELLTKPKVRAVVDLLHGSVTLASDTNGVVHDWNNPQGTLSLPAWRLLQFPVGHSQQLFSLVQNWVLVETRRLFCEYGPDQTRKTWEIATMAVLELRKAMMQAVNDSPPTLEEMTKGLNVHHNVDAEILTCGASAETATLAETATDALESLPHATTPCLKPYFSVIHNEKGVEGVFRGGFGNISIFFQMKLYAKATPEDIRDWLVEAHARASSLGYLPGSYVVQLFVSGTVATNVKKHFSAWPANSMVFADCALKGLFQPFGAGLITQIVTMLER